MDTNVLYLATDHVLEVPVLTNGLTGATVTGATVTATLLDGADLPVTGQTWPLLLQEDAAVPGRYLGTLSAALAVTDRQRLKAVVVADAGAGLKRTWYMPVVALAGTP